MHHSEHESELSHSPPSSYVPLNIHRSYTSTPSLCSASDTDTESETPSVSSPCPSSPAESDLAHYFEPHGEAFDNELHRHYRHHSSNHNPYFPAIPASVGVLQNVIAEDSMVTKIKLEALPSPALQPPSPLSLDGTEEGEEGSSRAGAQTVMRGSPIRSAVKRPYVPRPSSLSSRAQQQETLNAVSESLSALATSATPLVSPSPALDTPELTIESMRAPAYFQVPLGWRRVPQAVANDGMLEPSIRRREL